MFERKDHARERTSPICAKIKNYRPSRDALGRLLKKMKKKKMENSRVCRLLASGTIGVFYACLQLRVELVKLSGVTEKAYNSRPSEFGGFWLCACIRAIPT